MRVVVDTHVFVSAALKESSWPAIAVRWVDKYGVFLKSLSTEQEVMQVLQRPRFSQKILPIFMDNLSRMFAAAEMVRIAERVTVCRDPKDDKFLELALNGRADLIISGDADLLALDPFLNIPIIDPATFGRSQIR
ncbi:MAG: putative toxin-antitoxin system toxin component, PIN family [Betaproteobacteria bacterium]|nr:MAG: putative toxin-antitoxin system toxin component, PIN family [Betaproteobacteria bacterium]